MGGTVGTVGGLNMGMCVGNLSGPPVGAHGQNDYLYTDFLGDEDLHLMDMVASPSEGEWTGLLPFGVLVWSGSTTGPKKCPQPACLPCPQKLSLDFHSDDFVKASRRLVVAILAVARRQMWMRRTPVLPRVSLCSRTVDWSRSRLETICRDDGDPRMRPLFLQVFL